MSSSLQYDVVVIGGGFFGCSLALHLRQSLGQRVLLLEMGPDLLIRASYVNQARVHAGYHYPRSYLTGVRSRVNYAYFVKEFEDCIDVSFEKYYAIGRKFSKVTADQFKLFCERIGAPIRPAPDAVKRLFNPQMIEDVFSVEECAFDSIKLKNRLKAALRENGVELWFNTEATRVSALKDGLLQLEYSGSDGPGQITAGSVYNCTYSRINKLLSDSGLPLIPLKHEQTELALVKPPPQLKDKGITVMCGPFFSIMPFPPRKLHSFSHVRYTPHLEWHTSTTAYRDPYEVFQNLPRNSNYERMVRDAQRYLPIVNDCRYVNSIWEIKTVLPRSEADDSRPILLKRDHGLPNLHCVTGAKVDNVYDILKFFRSHKTVESAGA